MWMAFGIVLAGTLGYVLGCRCEAREWQDNAMADQALEFDGGLYKVVEIHSPKSARSAPWNPKFP